MTTKDLLDRYLGKNTRITETDKGNGFKEVCDLDTGDCYTVRMKDGLIERVDNTMFSNKKINVETKNGFKQLLNGYLKWQFQKELLKKSQDIIKLTNIS